MPTGDPSECGEAVGQSEGAPVAAQVGHRTGPGYGWINTNTSEHTTPILAAQSHDVCSNTPSLQIYITFSVVTRSKTLPSSHGYIGPLKEKTVSLQRSYKSNKTCIEYNHNTSVTFIWILST